MYGDVHVLSSMVRAEVGSVCNIVTYIDLLRGTCVCECENVRARTEKNCTVLCVLPYIL